MHLTKKDYRLLLILLGLVLFALAYFGLVRPLAEKKAGLETQIESLASEKELLLAHQAQLADYTAEMQRIAARAQRELNRFPTDLRSEDLILYAGELREKTGITTGSIQTGSPSALMRLYLPADETGEAFVRPVVIMETSLQMSCSFSYQELKQLVNVVNANAHEAKISFISVGSGGDGKLSGQLSISRYFRVTEEYQYTESPVPPVARGNANPFGVSASTDSAD